MSEKEHTQENEGSLTRRAGLTFASSLLQQGAQLIVGFIVIPIIIHGLGAELYGAWMMIKQAAGYTAQADLRPMGTLKFTLAVTQHVKDVQEKRRQIGAAILIWGLTLPIIFTLGAGLLWAAPSFIRVSDEHIFIVRVAMVLVILHLAMERVLTLPDNVLRGMNLHYKAMGLNAVMVLCGGFLSAVAIWMGWGLPGVAAGGIIASAGAGGVRFIVAKRVLSWFGAARPKREEFFSFGKLSGWLMFSGLAGTLFSASDLLVLGIVLGPSVTAVYATTGAVIRMLIGPLGQLLSSGGPGIAGLCGEKDWRRVAAVRKEMYVVGLIMMTVIGAGILALNSSFLKLWLGEGFYAGDLTNLLLVLIGFMMIFFRIDGVIIDSMLLFRKKAAVMLVSGLVAVTSGALLSFVWGTAGMAFGILCSYIVLLSCIQILIRRKLSYKANENLDSLYRPVVVSFLLLIGAYYISSFLNPETWLSLLLISAPFGCVTFGLMWFIGLSKIDRGMLVKRVAAQINRYRLVES